MIRPKQAVLAVVLTLATAVSAESVAQGLWKEFAYDQPSDLPIIFGGWSRAEGAAASEYCVMADVAYADGTYAWARKANFDFGTHDWQNAAAVFVPKKPVKWIKVHAIFRTKGAPTAGQVAFRDFFLERREGKGEEFPVLRLTDRPFANADELTVDVLDGRTLRREFRRLPRRDAKTSPVPAGTVAVWTEDSMRLVTPLTFPRPDATESIVLSLAGRERESAQILLSAAADAEWTSATLDMPVLKAADGTPFEGTVTWQRQGYLKRALGAARHPYAFPAGEKWFPDPLLPPAPMRVRPASTQGAWLTVYAAPEAKPGVYCGEVVVREKGEERARVPMTVTVEPFSLPKTFGLHTAYSLMDGHLRATYGDEFRQKKSEAIDIMLDHRLNPDDISRTTPPEIADLFHARDRGMNNFNILNVVPPPKDPKAKWVLYAKPEEIFNDDFYRSFVGRVKSYVAELKKHGLEKLAYVYGFDERGEEYYAGIEDFWNRFRRDVPDIPLMNTAKTYCDFAKGRTNVAHLISGDWYCPHTNHYDFDASERLRAMGKKVWWYTCCWPQHPYANFASWEYPPIEGRLLGWMTWRMKADGFLFWIVNKWNVEDRLREDDTYFPEFDTANGLNAGMAGDGVMIYPGERHLFTSIKLAQCRDAVEDYEYLQLFAAKRGREAADRMTDAVMTSMTEFSRSPEALRRARARLAQAISGERVATVDGKGVMRWADDGGEVAVFGVNYYTPFHTEYRETKRQGYDPKEVIRHDVAHLRRLGFDAVRLHCFDREISDREGRLVDNEHLELLDYLIAACASNGMCTVLTPIAGWGMRDGDATNGFSFAANRIRLSSEPRQVAIQMRYEEEFARHVNRYTGRRYADDPAVLCFELVNEPEYAADFTGEQAAAYANRLLEGIRRSGTRKPVFYNAVWRGGRKGGGLRFDLLKTDGVTGECYCTGLRAGSALEGPQLRKVVASGLAGKPIDGFARLIYEFDAADTPGAYMYPAMAKMFRSEGVQSATQFQYESMPIADVNISYKTHYLNLVYTPEKAISMAIAAEAFRRVPRGTPYAPDDRELVFPPFCVNVEANLSEMATETDYLYTARPLTPPPNPARLRRVWGCGSSAVASSDGSGCYFLDRVAAGVWRLQVYPSVLPIADPHTGTPNKKTVVLADRLQMTVSLPDLGGTFAVLAISDGARTAQENGRFRVSPGDYVLVRKGIDSADALSAAHKADIPAYYAPPPDTPDPAWRRWPPSREDVIAATKASVPSPDCLNFIDFTAVKHAGGKLTTDAHGNQAFRCGPSDFKRRNTLGVKVASRGWLYKDAFPSAGPGRTIVLTGRSGTDRPEPVEFALTMADGQVWGTVVTLPVRSATLRIPMSDLKYFSHWQNAPAFREGLAPDMRELVSLSFLAGRWLNPKSEELPHAFEISFVGVE